MILLQPKVVKEFIKDSRFKTIPKFYEVVAIIGINCAVTGGLLVFIFGLLSYLFQATGTTPELSVTHNQIPYLPYNQITKTFDYSSGFINFLAVVIIAPFYEELLYRGLALRVYEKARSPLFAAIFTAVLFSCFHLDWVKLLFFIPSSFITARAVQSFGSWWIALIVHMIYNGFIFFLNSATFINKGVTENSIPLSTSFLGLIIAIVAFIIVIYWFNICSNKTSLTDNKKEKIITPSLTFFATICFWLMIR